MGITSLRDFVAPVIKQTEQLAVPPGTKLSFAGSFKGGGTTPGIEVTFDVPGVKANKGSVKLDSHDGCIPRQRAVNGLLAAWKMPFVPFNENESVTIPQKDGDLFVTGNLKAKSKNIKGIPDLDPRKWTDAQRSDVMLMAVQRIALNDNDPGVRQTEVVKADGKDRILWWDVDQAMKDPSKQLGLMKKAIAEGHATRFRSARSKFLPEYSAENKLFAGYVKGDYDLDFSLWPQAIAEYQKIPEQTLRDAVTSVKNPEAGQEDKFVELRSLMPAYFKILESSLKAERAEHARHPLLARMNPLDAFQDGYVDLVQKVASTKLVNDHVLGFIRRDRARDAGVDLTFKPAKTRAPSAAEG